MSRITRLAVLAATTMSMLGALTSAAKAVTWDNSGSTTFTATTGAGTYSSTGAALSCTGATMTGTAPNNVVGVTFHIGGTITWGGCSLGGVSTGVDCSYSLTLHVGFSSFSATWSFVCGIFQFGSKVCQLTGAAAGAYTNPVSGVGVFSLTTGGSLMTSNGTLGTCPLGNGDRGHMSALTFRTTSATPPVITRTA